MWLLVLPTSCCWSFPSLFSYLWLLLQYRARSVDFFFLFSCNSSGFKASGFNPPLQRLQKLFESCLFLLLSEVFHEMQLAPVWTQVSSLIAPTWWYSFSPPKGSHLYSIDDCLLDDWILFFHYLVGFTKSPERTHIPTSGIMMDIQHFYNRM